MELCCGPLASVGFRLWALVEGLSKALSRTLEATFLRLQFTIIIAGFLASYRDSQKQRSSATHNHNL